MLKKYIIFLMLFVSVFAPASVAAEAPYILNDISGGEVRQYIVINCESEQCQAWLSGFIDNIDAGSSAPVIVSSGAGSPQGEDSFAETELAASPRLSDISSVLPAAQVSSLPEQIVYQKQILISEIMPAPTAGGSEWVELFNTLNEDVDLAGWQLIEGAGKKTELSGKISAGGYLVFEKSSLNNDGDAVILQDKNGQVIDLVSYGDWDDGDMSDNAPKSAVGNSIILHNNGYSETEIPTPGQANIFQLTLPVTVNSKEIVAVAPVAVAVVQNNSSNGTVTTESVAPPAATVNPAITPAAPPKEFFQFSDKIRVNELLPDPLGSDDHEWIEIYNGGAADVDLFGWTLDDAEGGSAPYKIDGHVTIKANGYLLFGKEETNLTLNNSADRAALFDPSGKMISQFSYQSVKENHSYSFFDDGWLLTPILTPGEENKKTALVLAQFTEKETDSPLTTVKSIKTGKTAFATKVGLSSIGQLKLKTKVGVSGQVLVLPKVFSKNTIYISAPSDEQEGEDVLQVYFYQADWPEFKLGDEVEIVGAVSESNGERRVLVQNKNDIKVIGNGEATRPREIDSSFVNDSTAAASFVQISGKLVEKKDSGLVIADDFGELNVYFKKGAGIETKTFELGDRLQIAGILSKVNGQYRLLPRGQEDAIDLTWQEKQSLGQAQAGDAVVAPSSSTAKAIVILMVGFGALALVLLYFLFKKKEEIRIRLSKIIYRARHFLAGTLD